MTTYTELLLDAEALRTAHQPTDALLALLKAERVNRHGVQGRIELAKLWEQLGVWGNAREAWEEVLRWQFMSQAQLGLARSAWRQGDRDTAAKKLGVLLQQTPQDVEALVLWADMSLAEGARETARKALRMAATQDLAADFWPEIDRRLCRCDLEAEASDLYRRLADRLGRSSRQLIADLRLADSAGVTAQTLLTEALIWPEWTDEDLAEWIHQALRLGFREQQALLQLAHLLGARVRGRIAALGGAGWPKRTAGEPLRVGVLLQGPLPAVPEMLAGYMALLNGEAAQWRVYALDIAATSPIETPSGVAGLALGGLPALQAARFIAEDDCDLLILGEGNFQPSALEILSLCSPSVLCVPPQWRLFLEALTGVAEVSAPAFSIATLDDAQGLAAVLSQVESHRANRPQAQLTAQQLRNYWQNAIQAHRAGRAQEADRQYTKVLEDQPGAAQVLYLRGSLRRDEGVRRAAALDFGAALQAQPAYLDAARALARLQLESGALAEAAETCRRFSEHAQADGRLRAVWGQALLKLGRPRDAAEQLTLAAQADPADAEHWFHLGRAQKELGDDAAALLAWQKAAVLDREKPESFFNLAANHQQQQEYEQAAACYEQVIRLRPQEARAYKNLGETLYASGNFGAWLANFARFEKACPRSFSLAVYALEASHFAGDWQRLDYYLNGLQQQRFQPADPTELVDGLEELLYLLLFFDVDPSQLGRFYRTYADAVGKVYGLPRPRPAVRRPGRWRIGYLSGDVRDQVMGKMIYEWLSRHDRARFEVYLYATRMTDDPWARRIAAASEHFLAIADLPDDAAIERITTDDLDLLIDCSTHTRGARQAILAAKPARVQLTSIASAGCLGMPTIDYKLSDALTDLPEMQEHQVEPLLAMAGCVYPFRALPVSSDPGFDRERLGIPSEAVVLGAFVNLLKLSRRCLKLWREILERLPEAVIALSPAQPGQREAYQRVFERSGISNGRLVFVPQGRDEAQNQARYRLIDMVLDPMPFGGANGTIEALAMKVPVITLCGRRHGERVGTSILSNLGLDACIAQSGPEYVELAVRLARDAEFRRQVLRELETGLAQSPLIDLDRHVRHLEAAYLTALDMKGVRSA